MTPYKLSLCAWVEGFGRVQLCFCSREKPSTHTVYKRISPSAEAAFLIASTSKPGTLNNNFHYYSMKQFHFSYCHIWNISFHPHNFTPTSAVISSIDWFWYIFKIPPRLFKLEGNLANQIHCKYFTLMKSLLQITLSLNLMTFISSNCFHTNTKMPMPLRK